MWHIGEFAQRLRVTARTVRHYEQIGLLLPQSIDPASGYRRYGTSQLMRGLQIEQLKAAGLALDDIRQVLDDPSVSMHALSEQRQQLEARITDARRQLATVDVLLAARARLAPPEIIETAACDAVAMTATASVDDLGREIRRAMQQLGRLARRHGARCTTYSARLPLDLDDAVAVVVLGHLEGPVPGSFVQPAERSLAATWTGSIEMLPLAYDLVLETARVRGMAVADVAVEHYLDLAAIGTTVVRVPLAS